MKHFINVIAFFGLALTPAYGQASTAAGSLDLPKAEARALSNQPRMLAAQLRARSIAERVKQTRSGYMPTLNFNATGAQVADTN